VTTAFAVGTVLAESGNDEFRWLRRLFGYGLGAGTAYLRLKHNQHWLSDTVAGAALGISSAHFTMNRHLSGIEEHLAVVPVPGGALLTYHVNLD
jgi:membrane-associated phospholipid phosphatase